MKTVSIDRAAEILQVSRRTIYNHIRRGYLQTIRTIGGQSQRVTLESLALVQGNGINRDASKRPRDVEDRGRVRWQAQLPCAQTR